MDDLMILTRNFQSYITFEFAHRQRSMPLGVVLAAFLDVPGRGPRQEMDRSHLGPDQAFDVSAKMGVAPRPPKLPRSRAPEAKPSCRIQHAAGRASSIAVTAAPWSNRIR